MIRENISQQSEGFNKNGSMHLRLKYGYNIMACFVMSEIKSW